MRRYEQATLIVLSVLTLAALIAVLLTRDWANYRQRLRASQSAAQRTTALVDSSALDTAQTLAALAVTRRERDLAQEAIRLGDYSTDLAFSIATQDAADHPAPMTPAIKALTERLKTAQDAVAADQAVVTGLAAQAATASPAEKDRDQAALAIIQTQLSLDQDDMQDAQQQLIRAGGDKQATIQQLLDQHNASEAHSEKASAEVGTSTASPESTALHNIFAQSRALISLRGENQQILQAQLDALNRGATLSTSHDSMMQGMAQEKAQSAATPDGDGMAMLQRMSADQKETAAIAKRIDTEQQLAANYGNWSDYVLLREKYFAHGILVAVLWIFVIAMVAWTANFAIQRGFARVALERRQLHTVRVMTLFFVQALGVVGILLVIFGMPSNLGTVLALTTAGFTVAMQDFILGFFGWFILVGRNGIRPGDWVEINGVSGEVLDVSVFHTVLLETGTGTDAGHPTGRKVSFMNNYAIQGRYFNFSTSGQWMWDEIEVNVSEGNPYERAEAIQKIVSDLTADSVRDAEGEWSRVAPHYVKTTISARPSMSIRPAGGGVEVSVRYITRASERYELRAKIYRAIVELLHNKPEPEPTALGPAPAR